VGFGASWAKDIKIGSKLINARDVGQQTVVAGCVPQTPRRHPRRRLDQWLRFVMRRSLHQPDR